MRVAVPHRGRAAPAIALVAALVLGACGVPEREVTVISRDDLPEALRRTTTTQRAGPAEPSQSDVAVYWIRDEHLIPESVTFESAPDVDRLVELLEVGPGRAGPTDGSRSAVSLADVVVGANRDDTEVVVTLADEFAEVTGQDQTLAIGQIVMTLTSIPGVDTVRFRRSGRAVEVPLPDGTLASGGVTAADYFSLVSPASPS